MGNNRTRKRPGYGFGDKAICRKSNAKIYIEKEEILPSLLGLFAKVYVLKHF